ncbi:MAG TPA: ABC transporter substrate-binding protein, partial [Reyranella sp.]|nr:ABC transporter substrate-binding protein [Reyranella sp.]
MAFSNRPLSHVRSRRRRRRHRSGPFIFAKEEWRPGAKVAYVRDPDHVPRKEKPDGLAGGKVAKVDRVEWLSMPDPTTAISALGAGEIDYLQNP